VRLLDRGHRQHRVPQREPVPFAGHRLAAQQGWQHLQGRFQPTAPGDGRAVVEAEHPELVGHVAAAHAEDGAATGEAVEVGRGPGEHRRVPVGGAADQRPEPDAGGDGGERGQGEPRVGHHHRVVGKEHRVESQLLELLDLLAGGPGIGPRGSRDREAGALGAFGDPGMDRSVRHAPSVGCGSVRRIRTGYGASGASHGVRTAAIPPARPDRPRRSSPAGGSRASRRCAATGAAARRPRRCWIRRRPAAAPPAPGR
jgi:hypothetical protein